MSQHNAVSTGNEPDLDELGPRLHSDNGTEESYKKVLLDSEKENGLVHSITIAYLDQVGKYYMANAKYLKAELVYKRAFVAAENLNHGPCDSRIAALLKQIVECGISQGKYAQATETLRRIHRIQRYQFGDESPETLRTQATMAIMYDKQKLWRDAEKLYVHVIEARQKRLGNSSEDTLRVMENLALNYRLRSKKTWARSAAKYEEIIGRRENLLCESGNRESTFTSVDEEDEEIQRERIKHNILSLAEVYEEMGDGQARRRLFERWSVLFPEDRARWQYSSSKTWL